MKKIRFGVEIGKEAREIDISLRDWQRIQKGEKVSLSMLNYYEADEFEYCFVLIMMKRFFVCWVYFG